MRRPKPLPRASGAPEPAHAPAPAPAPGPSNAAAPPQLPFFELDDLGSDAWEDVLRLAREGGGSEGAGGGAGCPAPAPAPVPTPAPARPVVQNIVSTACFANRLEKIDPRGTRIDLGRLADHPGVWNIEYNPKKFTAAILRTRVPVHATCLLFGTGKAVITGVRTPREARAAAKRFAAAIRRGGYKGARAENLVTHNVVGSIVLDGYVVGLDSLAARLTGLEGVGDVSLHTSYEPELFPGLIHRFPGSKTTFLVFVTGKVIVTGVQSEAALHEAFRRFFPHIEACRKVGGELVAPVPR